MPSLEKTADNVVNAEASLKEFNISNPVIVARHMVRIVQSDTLRSEDKVTALGIASQAMDRSLYACLQTKKHTPVAADSLCTLSVEPVTLSRISSDLIEQTIARTDDAHHLTRLAFVATQEGNERFLAAFSKGFARLGEEIQTATKSIVRNGGVPDTAKLLETIIRQADRPAKPRKSPAKAARPS